MKLKPLLVYALVASLLLPSFACSYKPAYLKESKKTEVDDRWRVEKIDASRLSADEKSFYESMGSPQFIRFYRGLLQRQEVYTWVYTDPIRFVMFIDGKKVDYIVLDDDDSRWTEHQRKVLFWGGITLGVVVAVAGLVYFLTK